MRAAEFDESKIKRDDSGKFDETGGGGKKTGDDETGNAKQPPAKKTLIEKGAELKALLKEKGIKGFAKQKAADTVQNVKDLTVKFTDSLEKDGWSPRTAKAIALTTAITAATPLKPSLLIAPIVPLLAVIPTGPLEAVAIFHGAKIVGKMKTRVSNAIKNLRAKRATASREAENGDTADRDVTGTQSPEEMAEFLTREIKDAQYGDDQAEEFTVSVALARAAGARSFGELAEIAHGAVTSEAVAQSRMQEAVTDRKDNQEPATT